MRPQDPSRGLAEHLTGVKAHEQRAEFLEALAVLFGCVQDAGSEFPDGRRPDVARLDSSKCVFFIGEAKDTESPGNIDTQLRLLSYLKWVKAYIETPGRTGVVAVCFGQATHTSGWGDTLDFLGREAGMSKVDGGVKRFDVTTRIVWRIYGLGRSAPVTSDS